MIAGAGLPPVARVLSEARSYAERLFTIRPIGPLDHQSTATALASPASDRGVEINDDALDEIVKISAGYPFFIQTYGKHAWDLADSTPITLEDVELATPRAHQELIHSFFQPRYERATPAERRYLHALADLKIEPAATADVAEQLGHTPGRVSPQRDGLLAKGLVYAPQRGQLAFTVPHMGLYLRNLPERA